MELFARFLLNRLGIALQRLDLLRINIILVLQAIDVFSQNLDFGAFLFVRNHTVVAEHDMQEQPHREYTHRSRSKLAPKFIQAFTAGPNPVAQAVERGLSLRRSLHEGTKAVLWPRQVANSAESVYSKIHFLAAALNFSSPSSLRASAYTRTTGSVPDRR